MAQTIGYKSGNLESTLLEPGHSWIGYVQIVIEHIPPHPSARFGFEQGVGTWEVIWVQVEAHYTCDVHHFSDLMCVSCYRCGKFEHTNKGQDGVRKSRPPVVKQIDNLEDCRHHVIQVVVIRSFKDREGLF